MASTKLVSDLITRSQNEFKGITLATTDAIDFANEIYQIIGQATFWDWLLVAGTTFGTTADVQDYSNVPADFMALKAAYIQDDTLATNLIIPIELRESLPKASQPRSRPRVISVENSKFRFYPVPNITRSGSGQWAVLFEYWKRPKRLSAVGDNFEFDDAWFEVMAAGFNARVAQFLDDELAGTWAGRLLERGGYFGGTGRWGNFANLLNNMLHMDEIASGSIMVYPEMGILRR